MLRNYLKIAWRNMARHKVYAAINVLGLAFGICSCLVIYLITSYELSFDKFHPDKDRIYRVVGEIKRSDGELIFLNSPFSDVAGLQKSIPGFEAEAGLHLYSGNGAVKIPEGSRPLKKFDNHIDGSYQSATIITSPGYFKIFKYQWLAGNPQSLSEPFKVVLSEKKARIYFGDIPFQQVIGKAVIYEDSLIVNVSGIVKDWNENSDLAYTDFISASTATHSFLKTNIATDDWNSLRPHSSMAFVKLQKGVSAAQINDRFAKYISQNVKQPVFGTGLKMELQPLTTMHYTSEFHRGDDGDDFRKSYLPVLYILMGVALFILLIATVNFINLSTAQSLQRAKEIGIRKVMGSNRTNIRFQFLFETLIFTLLAVIMSVLLVRPVLWAFSSFIPEGVLFHLNFSTLVFLLMVTTITTFLAGFYPAQVLASYLPALSLKGIAGRQVSGRGRVRKALIVFQFSISLVFIIGAIVMGNQIRYMRNSDKGFNTQAILTINHWRDRENKLKLFSERIKHIQGLDKVILQGQAPMGFAHGVQDFKYKGKDEITIAASFDNADENYIPFYQMKLLAGRNIMHSDSLGELVINETCTKQMGLSIPADAIGQSLYLNGKPHLIAGVVADFHEGSFHETTKPVVIATMPGRFWSVAIKLAAGKTPRDIQNISAALEKEWKIIYPEDGFNCRLLEDSIAELYEQETNTAWLVNASMLITIFISCMGLFGLAMFTAEKKTKEIGIRKVLGASVADITGLLSREFLILVFISMVIASPAAWYLMNQWLQDFAFRVDISWWVFVLAGASAILIALLTVSFRAVKAALANPVKSLRTE